MPIDVDKDELEFDGLDALDDNTLIHLTAAAEAHFGSSQRTVANTCASQQQEEDEKEQHIFQEKTPLLPPISPRDSFSSRPVFSSSPRMDGAGLQPGRRRPWEKSTSYADYYPRGGDEGRRRAEFSRHESSPVPVPMGLDLDLDTPPPWARAHMSMDAIAMARMQNTRDSPSRNTTTNNNDNFIQLEASRDARNGPVVRNCVASPPRSSAAVRAAIFGYDVGACYRESSRDAQSAPAVRNTAVSPSRNNARAAPFPYEPAGPSVYVPAEVPLPRLMTDSTRASYDRTGRVAGRGLGPQEHLVRARRNPQRNLWSDPDIPWHPTRARPQTPEPTPPSSPEKAFSPDEMESKALHPVRGAGSLPPTQLPPMQAPTENAAGVVVSPLGPESLPLPQDPPLCPEQAALVELIASGQNVFYTGAAGCGKSTVLRAAVKRLLDMYKKVHVVAPTGLAARNVSGVTTWTYAGLTPELNNFPLGKIEERAKGKKTRRRLENTDVLIIDEISMVDSIHLHRLDAIMRSGRSVSAPSNRFRPFGGVQVVFVGDFCQLPPVKPFENCLYCGSFLRPNTEETVFTCRKVATHRWAEEDKWAFKSTAWRDAQLTHVYLDTIHRQKEAAFVDILNKLRVGAFLNRDEVSMLQNNRPKITDSAVRLYSTREEVRRENSHKFLALPTEPHEFYCLDSFHWMRGRDSATEFLHGKTKKSEDGNLIALRDHRFERHTRIKKGMLVALITNLDVHAGLCNGAQGKVIGWKPYDPACLPTYQGDPQSKEPPSSPTGRAVETGEHAEIREQEVRKFCQQRVDKMREDVWPEVYFFPYNGRPGFTRVIYPACTTTTWREEDLSEVLLCRTQIPLVPAWAMTIHKSQGMTLSRVIVDLAREFEEGQAYVALSRATGLDGLIVERAELLLEPKNRANKEVRRFYLEKFGERVFGDSFKDSGIYAGT